MQDALRHSAERFRVALKDSPITVFNQDAGLRYTWIYNPQLYWQYDVLGKTDDEIIGPKKAATLNDLKRTVLASGAGVREEVAIPQNGTSHVFDITIEPLFDAQQNVIGITAACMSRSMELTKGSRGRIFVIWILFFVLNVGVSWLLQWPILAAMGAGSRGAGLQGTAA